MRLETWVPHSVSLSSNRRPASPARAGKLDLDLYGDPRNSQGESFAQNIGGAGKSRESAAMSAGFGAIALVGLWRTWRLWRDPSAEDRPKK